MPPVVIVLLAVASAVVELLLRVPLGAVIRLRGTLSARTAAC
jgi:hypothetical protein